MSDPIERGLAQAALLLGQAVAFTSGPVIVPEPDLRQIALDRLNPNYRCAKCGTDDVDDHGCIDCGDCPCTCDERCGVCRKHPREVGPLDAQTGDCRACGRVV